MRLLRIVESSLLPTVFLRLASFSLGRAVLASARRPAIKPIFIFGLVGISWVLAAGLLLAQTNANGYYYHVQPLDTWYSIAQVTGYSIDTLQSQNPQSVRDFDIVYQGEKLLVPADFSRETARYHEVQAGESWSGIAASYSLQVNLLLAANGESSGSPGLLSAGRSLFIPPLPSELTNISPRLPPTLPQGVTVPSAYQSQLPDVSAFSIPEPEEQPLLDFIPSLDLPVPECPFQANEVLDFLESTLAYWSNDPQGLVHSAIGCDIAIESLISNRDINGDGFTDLLLTYGLNGVASPGHRMGLVLFHWQGEKLVLELEAKAAGELLLLAVGDINADQLSDLVYSDESCGAEVCYTSVFIESWDPTARRWQNWTAAPMAMVNAEVKLSEAKKVGDGLAVSIQGGIYENVDAGPQRARTEIWASPDGQPFQRVANEYGPTSFLYHVVMEAHHKTLQSPYQDLYAAQILYRQALADNILTVWHDSSERDYLRSFSLLRLAIIAAYQEQPDVAAEIIDVLSQAYPSSVFTGLGRTWHQAYTGAGDSVVACTAAQAYVASHPATWQPFGAFGYANPPLKPSDICPFLTPFPNQELPTTEPGTAPGVEEPFSLFPSAAKLRNMDPFTFAASDELPICPGTLDGYPNMVETLLNGLKGDLLLVETWLRLCNVLSDEEGTIQSGDLNGDGQSDVVALVVGTDENSLGSDQKGSRMMVYYQSFGSSFNLIFLPPTLGVGSLLALEDFNVDGKEDLAWVDTVCNFLCLSTVEVLSWDGDFVNSHIRQSATIANGTVRLAPVPATNPGQGQQIILEGGISGLIADEQQVARVELWESIEGKPFQRVWYEYDPENPASRCLGLNLVEADVVLEGSSAYGYGPALQLYRNVLDDSSLQACSITGTPSETELSLLRGLTYFRLVQVHALTGDMRSSLLVLNEMLSELSGNPFLAIAQSWRTAYSAVAHPVTACQIVLPLIQAEPSTWQVTDIFGMDHPSETESTLCFVPETVS